MEGLIIKGIGGFYYVKTAVGIFQTRGRGIFKKDGIVLSVGDIVDMETLPDGDGVINSLLPRKNHFIRPPIANIDSFIVVMAASHPKPNYAVIDKFLIMAECNDIEPVICINKKDLVSEKKLDEIKAIYEPVYKVITACSTQGDGMDEILEFIKDKKVAFAGPSGVGKSTITNAIIPHANMETGDVSQKTNRGRHTTRHVEIFETVNGGYVYDTPGFTSFDIMEADEDTLAECYPEFLPYKGKCRFDNCRHKKEPGCAVIEAVENSKINLTRYNSYISNLDELLKKKKY